MRRGFLRLSSFCYVLLSMALLGCTSPDPYTSPLWPFQRSFSEGPDAAPVLAGNIAWWEDLHDPTLNRLVALAMRDSLSLELARERVIEATQARNSIAGAATVSPSAQVLATDANTADFDVQSQAEFGLSWILDPYGARASARNAANGRIDIATIELDAARLLLLFNITSAYAELRYQQQVLGLVEAELRSRQRTLGATRALAEAEAATRLEIVRSRARVVDIRAEIPQRQAAIVAQIHQIASLVGTVPQALPSDLFAQLEHGQHRPSARLSPDVGIPTDLLRNRPDIQISEREYYVAVSEIGVAEANLYPRLSLSGAITLNGAGSASNSYYFGPVLQFPTLPLAAGRAAVEVRHSAARQRHTAWKVTVLQAIVEVEQALTQYRGVSSAMTSAREASQLYGEALSLTRELFRQGEVALGDLIAAEQALATANRALADLERQHVQRFIDLNVRLGSGHAVGDSLQALAPRQ